MRHPRITHPLRFLALLFFKSISFHSCRYGEAKSTSAPFQAVPLAWARPSWVQTAPTRFWEVAFLETKVRSVADPPRGVEGAGLSGWRTSGDQYSHLEKRVPFSRLLWGLGEIFKYQAEHIIGSQPWFLSFCQKRLRDKQSPLTGCKEVYSSFPRHSDTF